MTKVLKLGKEMRVIEMTKDTAIEEITESLGMSKPGKVLSDFDRAMQVLYLSKSAVGQKLSRMIPQLMENENFRQLAAEWVEEDAFFKKSGERRPISWTK